MKYLVSLFFLAIVFGFSLVTNVFAANALLSGRITDKANNAVGNAVIVVVDPKTQAIVGTTVSGLTGYYSMSVPQGTYNLNINPPTSSGFKGTTITNATITGNSSLNFSLPTQPGNPPVASTGTSATSKNAAKPVSQIGSTIFGFMLGLFVVFVVEGIIFAFWKIRKNKEEAYFNSFQNKK